MNKKDLLALKEKIDAAKVQVATLEGKREYLFQELQDTWGCKSVKQAEKKLVELQNEVAVLTESINKGIAKLEESYHV